MALSFYSKNNKIKPLALHEYMEKEKNKSRSKGKERSRSGGDVDVVTVE